MSIREEDLLWIIEHESQLVRPKDCGGLFPAIPVSALTALIERETITDKGREMVREGE